VSLAACRGTKHKKQCATATSFNPFTTDWSHTPLLWLRRLLR